MGFDTDIMPGLEVLEVEHPPSCISTVESRMLLGRMFSSMRCAYVCGDKKRLSEPAEGNVRQGDPNPTSPE